jgi:transketolase
METFSRLKFSRPQYPKLIIVKIIIGFGINEIVGISQAHGTRRIKFIVTAEHKIGIPPTKFFVSEATEGFFTHRKWNIEKNIRHG